MERMRLAAGTCGLFVITLILFAVQLASGSTGRVLA